MTQYFKIFLYITAFSLVLQAKAGQVASPEKLKDPTVVRCYLFQEGMRGQVKQLAGNGEGDLFLGNNTLYGEPFIGSHRAKWLGIDSKSVGTLWGAGRFPDTYSIRPGNFNQSVVHSRFYTTPNGIFSIEAWLRPREGGGALIWAGGSQLEKGGFGLKDDGKNLEWLVMTKSGQVKVQSPALSRGLWHHVACVWEGGSQVARLYVDGAPAGESRASAPFWPSPPSRPTGFENPEDDYAGMRIGGQQGNGVLTFDIDELWIYSRVLTDTEIAHSYTQGKPSGTSDENLARYEKEKAREGLALSLGLSIPRDSFGYFSVGSAIPVTFKIPAGVTTGGAWTARWVVRDIDNKVVKEGKEPLQSAGKDPVEKTASLVLSKCGVYFLFMEIRDEKDQELSRIEYPLGIIAALPPPDKRPESSPLGAHAAIDRWPEATVLGVSNFRLIGWWEQMEPKVGAYNFDWNDQMINEALKRNMEVMFCLNGVPLFEDDDEAGTRFADGKRTMDQYREFWTQLVRRYKGKVKYWEIINETNATQAELGGGTVAKAKRYVKVLKTAYEVIKKEDPEAKVVGICGCPGFVPWTESVLGAGGGPYFDILSVHNYRVVPIEESVKERNIANVRDVLRRYGKDCPVWNTEFGVHQPRRINGRPMPRETLLKLYASKLSGGDGKEYASIDMPLVPESQAAYWTIQSWLLDFGNGVSRFYMLMGPNRFTPDMNDAEGTPSEMGVAFAAMASVVMPMEKAEMLTLDSQRDVAVLIQRKGGRRDVALFSEDEPELAFKAPNLDVLRGMDWLGNPWSQKVDKDGLVRVKIGPRPLYLSDVPKGFAPVSLIRATFENGKEKTGGILEINNPGSKDVTWRLSSNAPKGILVETQNSITVPAGGRVKVPFVLRSKEVSRGTHEITFTLSEPSGTPVACTQYSYESLNSVISVPRAKNPIPFRANPDDWKDTKAVMIDSVQFVVSGKPVQGVPWAPQWRGAADLSFKYRMAWDPSGGLAILIEVVDDEFRPAPDEKRNVMFQYDCLEVFLDTRPANLRMESYSPGVDQILVRPVDGNEPSVCVIQKKNGDGSPYDVRFIGRRTKNGYILEGRIKPAAGAIWKLESGLPFALDLLLDDADKDLRKTIMGIGFGGNEDSISTKNWGWFQLE
jgi:hypothetical protein